MRHDINPNHVTGTIIETNAALKGKGFNQAEVMLGLQELVGRLIVEMTNTSVAADELAKFAKSHLDATISVGTRAKQEQVIARV